MNVVPRTRTGGAGPARGRRARAALPPRELKEPGEPDDVAALTAVGKRYGSRVVYDGFDFLVRRGERWCVMGKNGAGKSTLLKMVSGALEPRGAGRPRVDRDRRARKPPHTCPGDGHDDGRAVTLDALDVVARLLAHAPDPRRHLVHDYGACSNVVRGKAKARSQARQAEPLASGPASPPPLPAASMSPSSAALRRGWARLIRRVYEVDPLVRPRCRGVMRVVAFITQPRVIRLPLDHLAASARRATRAALPLPSPDRPPHSL